MIAYHGPTFLAEYEAFHQLMREGRQLEIDPLWLATLFLVRLILLLSEISIVLTPINHRRLSPFQQIRSITFLQEQISPTKS